MNYNYNYLKLMRKHKDYTTSELSKLIGMNEYFNILEKELA